MMFHLPTLAGLSRLQSVLQVDKVDCDSATSTVHSLRRIFTSFFHDGRMSGKHAAREADPSDNNAGAGSASSAGVKRKRPSEAEYIAQAASRALRSSFMLFLESLLRILARKSSKSSADHEAFLNLQVLALSTIIHFLAHANSIAGQIAQGSVTICYDVLLWSVRHFLTAGSKVSRALYQSSVESSSTSTASAGAESGAGPVTVPDQFVAALTADLSTPLNTFRQEFCDDYDDIRYFTMKAVRDICVAKHRSVVVQQTGSSAASSAAAGSKRSKSLSAPSSDGNDADDAASVVSGVSTAGDKDSNTEQLVKLCHVHAFARNAADLLLGLSLPLTEQEWDEADHDSYVNEQIGEDVQKYKEEHGLGDGSADKDGDAGSAAAAQSKKSSGAKYLSAGSDSDSDGGSDSDDDGAGASSGNKKSKVSRKGAKYFDYLEQKRALGDAWIALLRLPLPADVQRRVLLALPVRILPLMVDKQPLLLADFLTDACDRGGAHALLALQSLFTLMQRHGLEYPRFYSRLYAMLTVETCHAKYRSRFLTLLDLFLSSPVLPAYLTAAFCKRLARVALNAPVGMALFIVPEVYNIIKRHNALLPLLHKAKEESMVQMRPGDAAAAAIGKGAVANAKILWPASADRFDAATDEPSASKALESSLWELVALQHHYHGPIATLARSLSSGLLKQEHDVTTFQGESSTYSALTLSEVTRSVRKQGEMVEVPVPFEHVAPGAVFVLGGGTSVAGAAEWVAKVRESTNVSAAGHAMAPASSTSSDAASCTFSRVCDFSR